MVPVKDEACRKLFLSTFQNVEGYPAPDERSKEVEKIVVQFVSGGNNNIISKDIWKLPRGAVDLAVEDRVFASVLLGALLTKRETSWREKDIPGFTCCGCDGVATNTLFVVPSWGPRRNLLNVGVRFRCGQAECKRKLREGFRLKFNVHCSHCFHPTDEPKLTASGNRQVRYYCSKECHKVSLRGGPQRGRAFVVGTCVGGPK